MICAKRLVITYEDVRAPAVTLAQRQERLASVQRASMAPSEIKSGDAPADFAKASVRKLPIRIDDLMEQDT